MHCRPGRLARLSVALAHAPLDPLVVRRGRSHLGVALGHAMLVVYLVVVANREVAKEEVLVEQGYLVLGHLLVQALANQEIQVVPEVGLKNPHVLQRDTACKNPGGRSP